MFRNYLIIILRNFKRNFTFSLINILGLTIGLIVSVLILLYVVNELTYDSYHKDANRVYRITTKMDIAQMNAQMHDNKAVAPLGPFLVAGYPKITEYTRISEKENIQFLHNNNLYKEEIFYADSSFFEIFTVNFLYGNPRSALVEPNSIVITKAIADKFFGESNPLGNFIITDKKEQYKVTGVVESIPENSHFKFDILTSFSKLGRKDSWNNINDKYSTYIKIASDYTPSEVDVALLQIIKDHLSSNPMFEISLSLEPLQEIYLYYGGGGNLSRILLFSAIGIFVLLIASINFMNLSTAQSATRMKEVGVRKVIGAYRKQLVMQFLAESIVFCLLALFLALTIAELLIPSFNGFLQKNLKINYITQWPLTLGFIFLALFVGFSAGSYPAFFLSSFKPITALKGKFVVGTGQSILRNILVTFQFTVSIFLICSTGIIYMQLNHINNTDLGFKKEGIMVIDLHTGNVNPDYLKNELLKLPEIEQLTLASNFPFFGLNITSFQTEESEQEFQGSFSSVDFNFIDLLGLEIIKGRQFLKENSTDDKSIIINETLAKEQNWENPIGKTIKYKDEDYRVIGVVKDYHYSPLHNRIKPIFLILSDFYISEVGLKIATDNIQETIKKIESVYKDVDDSGEFNFSFMDEKIKKMYLEENRTGKTFILFTILAIFIASMGLYGLASFVAKQRTKEIGIRKVLGSTINEIVINLSTDFLKLILIATVIAIPTSWYFTENWLHNFAYQVGNRWWIFVLSTVVAVFIAFITILHQSLKAAKANPIDTIRHE